MNDSWEERRKSLEDDYFEKKNEEALARIKLRNDGDQPRLSPVTGQPLEQLTVMGVAIDRCPTTGGIWLDAGELEEILTASAEQEKNRGTNLLSEFFATITGK